MCQPDARAARDVGAERQRGGRRDRHLARGIHRRRVAAGLKESGGEDVALVVNNGPRFEAAGVFTSNRVQAAPVLWSRQVLAGGGPLRAVILNSGGANACTGPRGFQNTHATARTRCRALGRRRRLGGGCVRRDSSVNTCRWSACFPEWTARLRRWLPTAVPTPPRRS